jgi:hypothetical protein
MMTLTESLLPYSIENFITDGEADRIVALIDRYKAEHPDRLQAGAKGVSVHTNDALSIEELVAMYEPQGRLDINTADLPSEVIDIVERAYFRHIEDIRRAYASAAWPYAFTYVEYGPTQFFTPHADGFGTFQCAGFGITLTNDFSGGEFCVETCGSNRFWVAGSDGTPGLAPGANVASDWFRRLPRTRWSMSPRKGVAAFYGSALVHSSKPVTSGTVKRLLAFISNA